MGILTSFEVVIKPYHFFEPKSNCDLTTRNKINFELKYTYS